MARLPNTEFDAPTGCTVNIQGVVVRCIAGVNGVTIEVTRDGDEFTDITELFIKYPLAEEKAHA